MLIFLLHTWAFLSLSLSLSSQVTTPIPSKRFGLERHSYVWLWFFFVVVVWSENVQCSRGRGRGRGRARFLFIIVLTPGTYFHWKGLFGLSVNFYFIFFNTNFIFRWNQKYLGPGISSRLFLGPFTGLTRVSKKERFFPSNKCPFR